MLIQASARHLPLADKSVQMCVTSPPYWGLRQYAGEQESAWGGDTEHAHEWGAERIKRQSAQRDHAPDGSFGATRGSEASRAGMSFEASQGRHCSCGAWRGALGLEPTPELYVEHMVEVFREVRRVLRDDGTLWLNLGDSYAASGMGGNPAESAHRKQSTNVGSLINGRGAPAGLKPKDLVGIPWRVAFALQADGWYLRSDIIWSKPNPMPESVTDRPTKSHEYLFLLTKSERYFYDQEAIREEAKPWNAGKMRAAKMGPDRIHGAVAAGFTTKQYDEIKGANARTVWTIATQPYAGAHFATFPPELPRRCILAGSAAQACAECGAPWERMVERALLDTEGWGTARKDHHAAMHGSQSMMRDGKGRAGTSISTTTGWRPTCAHDDGSSSSLVLDPFNGTGTTGHEALSLGRRYVGIDISREYLVDHAMHRVDPLVGAKHIQREAQESGEEHQTVMPL